MAVFDTAFHQTMAERAYTYALPKSLADEHGLRRYGAHGTSYQFLTRKVAQVDPGAQSCHLHARICPKTCATKNRIIPAMMVDMQCADTSWVGC